MLRLWHLQQIQDVRIPVRLERTVQRLSCLPGFHFLAHDVPQVGWNLQSNYLRLLCKASDFPQHVKVTGSVNITRRFGLQTYPPGQSRLVAVSRIFLKNLLDAQVNNTCSPDHGLCIGTISIQRLSSNNMTAPLFLGCDWVISLPFHHPV